MLGKKHASHGTFSALLARTMRLRILAALLMLVAYHAQGQSGETTTVDVKLNKGIDLKRFGGYDMDFVVTSVDPMKVCIVTVDRTKMITRTSSGAAAIGVSDYSGTYVAAAATSTSQTIPTTTPYDIPMTRGLPVEGSALQKMFLLYQDDRVVIYYHNTLATAAGEYRLRILTKPRNQS